MSDPTNEIPKDSAPEQAPAPAVEPERPLSVAGDLAGVIVAPGATFQGIVSRSWWYALVPLAILLVFNVVSSSLFMSKVDMGQLVRDQIRQSKFASQMSQAQIDEAAEKAVNRPKWITVVIGAVGFPVVVLIMALVFWLVLLAFGKEITFGRSFQATSWAMLPTLFATVIFLVTLFVKDPNAINVNNPIATNPAAFFEPDAIAKPLYALLSAIDIFKIWIIALMGIGLAAAARCKVSQATIAVASLYGFWVLVKVGLAAIF
jgi:hypothetical protein